MLPLFLVAADNQPSVSWSSTQRSGPYHGTVGPSTLPLSMVESHHVELLRIAELPEKLAEPL